MVFEQGDIIEVAFDPTREHKPQKKRPTLVVSSYDFNISNSLTIVCPISSREYPFFLHDPLPSGSCAQGSIIMEQVRAIDLEAHPCTKIGQLDEDALEPILVCLRSFF